MLSLSFAAFAQLGIPHNLFGSVLINGAPAPEGTTVSVQINGLQVTDTVTVDGKYGYVPNIFYVEDPNNDRSGSLMHFFVNGIDTGTTVIFSNGASTEANLSVDIAQPAPAPSGGGSGGGGGSSGSGFFGGGMNIPKTAAPNKTGNESVVNAAASPSPANASNNNTKTIAQCAEKWNCTAWSGCQNSKQSRACSDDNKCGTDLYKPWESQPCVDLSAINGTIQATGFAVDSPSVIGGAVVAVLIVLLAAYFIARKKMRIGGLNGGRKRASSRR